MRNQHAARLGSAFVTVLVAAARLAVMPWRESRRACMVDGSGWVVVSGVGGRMPYEIFVSYSRKAVRLCDQVAGILQDRLGYAGAVFVDREGIPAGTKWPKQIDDALSESEYMVLLATKEAVRDPVNILGEIGRARERNIEIIPIEFDKGAAASLVGESETQLISAARDGDSCTELDLLEHDLRRALIHRTLRNLEEYRRRSLAWVNARYPSSSFWQNIWEGMFAAATGPLVIAAPGGHGKSVIAAHFLRQRLSDANVYPIILDADMIARGVHALARDLGAHAGEDIAGHLDVLRERYQKKVIFLADGLDQIRLADDPKRTRIIDLLTLLSSASCAQLVITCRDDVWDVAYRSDLPFAVERVEQIDDSRLVSILYSHGLPPETAQNSLLRIPFFLDLTIRNKTVWSSIPKTAIEFLRRVFRQVRQESGSKPTPLGRRKEEIVRALARLQVAQLSYEIPRPAVEQACNLRSDAFRQALAELKDDRVVLERAPSTLPDTPSAPTLRLTHDLLDCFSMADFIYHASDRQDAARSICSRCENESGWSVISMLVSLADHYENEVLLRILFEEFLDILDRKKFGDLYMARAWAVTYALRDKMAILFPLVIEALGGRPVESLRPGNKEDANRRASGIGNDPRLTAEAAPSLASAFSGLTALQASGSRQAVSVLADGLKKWPHNKARFIEALAMYQTDYVRDILISLGNDELEYRTDLASLQYVAQGLRDFERASSIIRLLERITKDPGIDPVSRQRAYEALYEQDGRDLPEQTEEDILYGLAVRDSKGNYSDWKVVRDYAEYVYERAAKGRRQFSPAICQALKNCLGHAHTYVGEPAATALGCFDNLMARDALLDQLTRDVLPADVREACLRSLEDQLQRVPSAERRQAFRFVLLHAARISRHRDALTIARRLTELALARLHGEVGWLIDAGALEVVPPWPLNPPVTLHTTVDDSMPVDRAIEGAVENLGDIETGPDLEAKFRFTDLSCRLDHSVHTTLAATTWSRTSRFVAALQRDPALMRHSVDGAWIEPVPLGFTALPTVAAVHCIVLTADDQVLLARRSARVHYAPGHWSVSFEEQLNERDFDGEADPFVRAACRGFAEEFGGDLTPDRVVPLSAVLQIDLLNVIIVMLLRPDLSAAQIQERWRSGSPDAWEAQDVQSLPAEHLDRLGRSDAHQFMPLHVTSLLRSSLLQRWTIANP